jgi:hypothetical protein
LSSTANKNNTKQQQKNTDKVSGFGGKKMTTENLKENEASWASNDDFK